MTDPRIARLRDALLRRRDGIDAEIAELDELNAEIQELEARQRDWMQQQIRLDDAADLLESQDALNEREPWCWNDSPYAARLTELERELEA